MFKYIFLIFYIFTSFEVSSNDDLLTIQQKLDRLQREVSDLSQIVFSDKDNVKLDNNNAIKEFLITKFIFRVYRLIMQK